LNLWPAEGERTSRAGESGLSICHAFLSPSTPVSWCGHTVESGSAIEACDSSTYHAKHMNERPACFGCYDRPICVVVTRCILLHRHFRNTQRFEERTNSMVCKTGLKDTMFEISKLSREDCIVQRRYMPRCNSWSMLWRRCNSGSIAVLANNLSPIIFIGVYRARHCLARIQPQGRMRRRRPV
jgi:hypothetical protein